MTSTDPLWGLPDPDIDADLYADIPTKRFIAWVVDVILISLLTAVLVPFTLFTALFYLPFLYMVISFLYRWVSIARNSATPGMRFMSIELRNRMGEPLDGGLAALHTLGYFVSVAVFPLQLVSVALMLISARRQGLTDHILGTAVLNKPA
ncbi:MAG: RDD family protein [Rhodobacteraceae bacterium]|nr:RDD family protein [Alphaproteobacteria bacterium]MBT8473985.1 RDD family protein [Alphaproteobacteria bacterium]NNK68238.1 RDD family protein [Paracoccaceae bacterium]